MSTTLPTTSSSQSQSSSSQQVDSSHSAPQQADHAHNLSTINIRQLVRDEFFILFTNIVLRLLNLLGSGRFGFRARGAILRFLGYSLGKNVMIASDVIIHNRNKNVQIGENSCVNKRVLFDALAPIRIGANCDIGFNTVLTNSGHPINSNYRGRRSAYPSGPIIIEDFVWIACNVIVMGNVTIGRGSVVAAGSIVTKSVPPKSLVMGAPARVVKTLD